MSRDVEIKEIIAGAIANARGMRRGVPAITNVLDLLPEKLKEEVMDDADSVLKELQEKKLLATPSTKVM